MTETQFPHFASLDLLSASQLNAIMIVRDTTNEQGNIERYIRDVFVWAVIAQASDVHIEGHSGRGGHWNVKISVRHPTLGMINEWFPNKGRGTEHFKVKMFQVTNTAQGGSTPVILSTRFSMEFPQSFVSEHGLRMREGTNVYSVDVRVEYATTSDGWAFVCRLLDQQRTPLLDEFGLSYVALRTIKSVCKEPSGMVLVSGPTGSGKTTLLHAILSILNNSQNAITTLEHPVELRLHGNGPIKQIQVGGEITFASGLRSTLRQDPDIIMVGEIRDRETMEIALQAAQTGHLMLSTLHANGSAETISRALDLTPGNDAYRLAESLRLVIAQRLVSVFDPENCASRDVTYDERVWLATNGMEFIRRIPESTGTVKTGRQAVVEIIQNTVEIKNLIRGGRVSRAEIYEVAKEQLQFETLAMAGVRGIYEAGCRLPDCMSRLESTEEARISQGLRVRLATRYRVTLDVVSQAIDAFMLASEQGGQVSLEETVANFGARKRVFSGSDDDLLQGKTVLVEDVR